MPDVALTLQQGLGAALVCRGVWALQVQGMGIPQQETLHSWAGTWGHGRAMMCSCAMPHGCAMPHSWHWGWHTNSCNGEVGLRGAWGGHGGAKHQVTARPLVSHPALVT